MFVSDTIDTAARRAGYAAGSTLPRREHSAVRGEKEEQADTPKGAEKAGDCMVPGRASSAKGSGMIAGMRRTELV